MSAVAPPFEKFCGQLRVLASGLETKFVSLRKISAPDRCDIDRCGRQPFSDPSFFLGNFFADPTACRKEGSGASPIVGRGRGLGEAGHVSTQSPPPDGVDEVLLEIAHRLSRARAISAAGRKNPGSR